MEPATPSRPIPSPPPLEVTQSERFRLARLARDVALRVPGVAATDSGPDGLFATLDGTRRVEGVTCLAAPGAGYDVALTLVCGLVSLPTLGAAVRAEVHATARRAGLNAASVSVHIAEVIHPAAT